MSLPDLKVNLGSWSPSRETPRPSMALLQKAHVWRSLEERHIATRDLVKLARATIEAVPTGAEDVATWSLKESSTHRRTLQVYRSPVRGDSAPVMLAAVAHWKFDLAILHHQGAPVPQQFRAALRDGVPALIWSTVPGYLRDLRGDLSAENPETRWVDLDMFVRPPLPTAFSQFGMRRYGLLLGVPPQELQPQVCPGTLLGFHASLM